MATSSGSAIASTSTVSMSAVVHVRAAQEPVEFVGDAFRRNAVQ